MQCHEEIDFSKEFASEEAATAPGFVTPRRSFSSLNTPDAPRKVVPHFDEGSMDDEETVVEDPADVNNDDEKSVVEEEPVAVVVEEPAAVVEEEPAVVVEEEPAVVVVEPGVVEEEPGVVEEEPAAVVEEPAAVVEEPDVVIDEEPVATTPTTVIDVAEPDVVFINRKRLLIQVKEEDTRVSKKPKLRGRVEKVNSDGNCLFSSIADQYFGDARLHYVIRFMCYNYLEQHPEFKSFETTNNISQGFNFGEMAGELEIAILSMIFNCRIDVYDIKKNLILSHNSEATTGDVISLVYSNARTHYDSYHVDASLGYPHRRFDDEYVSVDATQGGLFIRFKDIGERWSGANPMWSIPEKLSRMRCEVKIEAYHWKMNTKGFYYGTVVDSVVATPEMLTYSDLTVIQGKGNSVPYYQMVEFECGEKVWVHYELLEERKPEREEVVGDNDVVQFTRSNRRIKKVQLYNPYRGY